MGTGSSVSKHYQVRWGDGVMSEFKARCPKCGSGGVSLFKDRSVGWSAREGASVLHCRTCGKQLYGEVADTEVARQYEEWKAAPKTERPTEAPLLMNSGNVTHRLLLQARGEAHTEATQLLAQAEELLRLALSIRDSERVNGFEVKCIFNLIELDVASVRRLHGEIPQQTVRLDIERRIGEIRKRLRELPVRIETLRARAKEEVENRPVPEPAPQPTQTPNQPETAVQKCAWKDCPSNARPESLYCSSDCRIKNARWNYAIKQAKPEKPVKAQVKIMAAPARPTKPTKPDLEAMNLNDLRKYATHVLKVERASKIPGGKPVLLDICRKVLEQRQLSA